MVFDPSYNRRQVKREDEAAMEIELYKDTCSFQVPSLPSPPHLDCLEYFPDSSEVSVEEWSRLYGGKYKTHKATVRGHTSGAPKITLYYRSWCSLHTPFPAIRSTQTLTRGNRMRRRDHENHTRFLMSFRPDYSVLRITLLRQCQL